LPFIHLLYRLYGGLFGLFFALYHLTPIGLLHTVWEGFMVALEGGMFIDGLTGRIRTSNPYISVFLYDVFLLSFFYLLYKRKD
jgi:hypothetical protein